MSSSSTPSATAAGTPDAGDVGPHLVSVGYLALTRIGAETSEALSRAGASWRRWYDFFPWEDWRGGRPALLDDAILPALRRWARDRSGDDRPSRRSAGASASASPSASRMRRWDEERVLDRYELLYSAGLVPEATRDGRPGAGRRPAAGRGRRADALRPPPHPRHRDLAAPRQAQVPAGGVRADGAGILARPSCSTRSRRSPAATSTSRISAAWSRPPRWSSRPARRAGRSAAGRPRSSASAARCSRSARRPASGSGRASRSDSDICLPLPRAQSKCRNQRTISNYKVLVELVNSTFDHAFDASGYQMANSLH